MLKKSLFLLQMPLSPKSEIFSVVPLNSRFSVSRVGVVEFVYPNSHIIIFVNEHWYIIVSVSWWALEYHRVCELMNHICELTRIFTVMCLLIFARYDIWATILCTHVKICNPENSTLQNSQTWFQVTMCHVARMAVANAVDQLLKVEAGSLFIKTFCCNCNE